VVGRQPLGIQPPPPCARQRHPPGHCPLLAIASPGCSPGARRTLNGSPGRREPHETAPHRCGRVPGRNDIAEAARWAGRFMHRPFGFMRHVLDDVCRPPDARR
jgi:hypothetical protein